MSLELAAAMDPLVGGQAAEYEEREALATLACLRFAVPAPPPPLDRRAQPTAASTASQHSSPAASAADSDCAGESEHRPRKRMRVVAAGSGTAAATRSYTWRGICSRRAARQQRQLDTLAPEQQKQAEQQQAQAPDGDAAAAHTGSTAPAADTAGSRKEGDREFAALTTWLRTNLHKPRTPKQAVQFVGRRDAATGRWAFDLNPRLAWGDVSPDTRRRLRGLPQEAAQAFARKYPGRLPVDWRLKAQRYKPPGSGGHAHLVLLEDLVTSLHALWARHEGGGNDASASDDGASAAAGVGAPAAEMRSCGSSAAQL